ncbi:hypothetical protein K491DRAFT_480186 [Lophiostoma macrostomum CBS 122681]|uniref:Uncharacterized protein n=1 Tax=Lophiostoma macrostomum CBS 122681 TaxID=1314788 RepID=A0A6A6TMX5_9PLEO|nr:hypothetical protein K491DRAFT_480186 [Lophiostoma macrostomum CBS 122681]
MTDHPLGDLESDDIEDPVLPVQRNTVVERTSRSRRFSSDETMSESPLSDPPEGLDLDDDQSINANEDRDRVVDVKSASEEADAHPGSPAVTLKETLAPRMTTAEETAREVALDVEREKLRTLLLWEFHDVTVEDMTGGMESEAADQDAEEMCTRTLEINKLLVSLWKADEKMAMQEMGEETFKFIHGIVNNWVSWREVAITLAAATHLHPLQQGPKPQLTLAQWRDRLEGIPRMKQLQYSLSVRKSWFEKLGKSLEEVSEHLAVL